MQPKVKRIKSEYKTEYLLILQYSTIPYVYMVQNKKGLSRAMMLKEILMFFYILL